jgi:hypothetical protein
MNRQPSPDKSSGNRKHANGGSGGAGGKLSVREAGRKGGQRVRELINRGREVEARQTEQRPH